MQVPLPPRSPEVQVSEFSPPRFQVPTTVAPLSGLCAASWTVISTVADQVVPSFEGKASRSPMWMLTEGASTEDVVEAWLFAALSSVTLWLAVSVWEPREAPAVFQLKGRGVPAPGGRPAPLWGPLGTPAGLAARGGSPATLWVPMVTPAVWSARVTLKVAPTGWVPTF